MNILGRACGAVDFLYKILKRETRLAKSVPGKAIFSKNFARLLIFLSIFYRKFNRKCQNFKEKLKNFLSPLESGEKERRQQKKKREEESLLLLSFLFSLFSLFLSSF